MHTKYGSPVCYLCYIFIKKIIVNIKNEIHIKCT